MNRELLHRHQHFVFLHTESFSVSLHWQISGVAITLFGLNATPSFLLRGGNNLRSSTAGLTYGSTWKTWHAFVASGPQLSGMIAHCLCQVHQWWWSTAFGAEILFIFGFISPPCQNPLFLRSLKHIHILWHWHANLNNNTVFCRLFHYNLQI